MAEVKKYLGRQVKEEHSFKVDGTFSSMYAANGWCSRNGYTYGSMCKDRNTMQNNPVALRKGRYDLPEKWINFDEEEKESIDGVIVSNDFREGEVKIYIFN